MVMARMLAEGSASDPEGGAQAASKPILRAGGRWSTEVLRDVLLRYGEDAGELSAFFERIRNAWMNERTDSWMQLHQVMTAVRCFIR